MLSLIPLGLLPSNDLRSYLRRRKGQKLLAVGIVRR
jgi:hypothetical protein